MITLTLNEAATVVACIEQYGKDAVPHVKAYFVAKERQDKAERDTTQSQNMLNSCRSKKTTTGVKGVSINKNNSANPYVAKLRLNRTTVFNEAYPTLDEARVAIRAARIKHHGEFANHG